MSAPAWMPLYVADYLADTRRLTTVEHGAYMLLIMEYWQSEGNLPNDDKRLALICGATDDEWCIVKPTMQGFFGKDFKHHKRIDEELKRAKEISERRSDAGRAAGLASAERRRQRSGNVRSTSVEPKSNPSPSPSPVPIATQQGDSTPREAELDRLESRLREAAGLQNAISTGLFDLSPIIGLLDKGYSLESDILPKLRAAAAMGKTPSTWAYYVPAITEGKAKTDGIAPKANGGPTTPMVWIDEDDPHFGDYAARYLKELGKRLIPGTSKHGNGYGAFVPADWPESHPH